MIKLHIIIKSCHMDGHSVHISIGNAIMGVLNLNSWHNNSILITLQEHSFVAAKNNSIIS